MKLRSILSATLLGLATATILPAAAPVNAQQAEVDPEDMVNAINEAFGSHKGYRAVHAKGFCGAGSLKATPEAAEYTKATLFDGHAVPTMFRFSLAPGAPNASDLEQAPRSLVARFEDADGTTMDMVMINVPFVFVKDPVDFAPFFRALKPDPATGKPDGAKLQAHLERHPEAARFIEYLDKHPIPASYATTRYYAVHTFYFTNAKGERRPARWTAEPAAGEAGLTDEQAKGLTTDYLQAELRQRAEKEPVAWDLYLQFPEAGDPLLDASSAWPEDRRKVKVARLELASVDEAGNKGPCDEVMFDPTSVPEGIETPDDPVLLIRPAAYAVSFSRRMEQ
jgi:catalase